MKFLFNRRRPGGLKVIAGTINLKDAKSTHEVETITVHEQYNPSDSWRNDIAILKVSMILTKCLFNK